jgi:isopentenyldiphosphate isomerase
MIAVEYLDVVDKDDHVIGRASKADIYKKKLRHRIVHVLVFDRKGRMLLQLRSGKCSFCPLHWSTAVGGHVRSGEDCETAALREYEEELGATSELEFLGKDYYESSTMKHPSSKSFLITFKTKNEGPFRPDPHAVEKAEFFSMKDIRKMVARGEKMHPELLFLLREHYNFK